MKKIVIQAIICMLLVAGYNAATGSEIDSIKNAAQAVSAQMNKEYTTNDIKAGKNAAVQVFTNLPAKISTVFEDREYGEPIDEAFSGKSTLVYAVAGGTVTTVSKNDTIGNYIVISHGGESESIYGNLSQIKVKSMQKIKKGQIIASFEKNGESDFFYSITEK
ncbi:MAG: M23 family metallopeptidase [Eubacteriales bacterium]|nr:M23 family metallopeptidase [Eubacteriales bacterium]MDD4390171.1 M23 family metallopeptidase [Eubacteriales bacterium]